MRQRWLIDVTGYVQGVGYRPFVHRAATARGLGGGVRNAPQGVEVEAEGDEAALSGLVAELRDRSPAGARVESVGVRVEAPRGVRDFRILPSGVDGAPSSRVPLDAAPCEACAAELLDPASRRYRYPFVTCAACGPRFTLVETLPFDRARTAMRRFEPCAACAREYSDPADRRYHAPNNACPACGPVLSAGLDEVLGVLRRGGVVAVKGVGGFQLVCDAASASAVDRIRRMKERPHKPFALLLSTIEAALGVCEVDALERSALLSPAAPIVLLRRAAGLRRDLVCAEVAPEAPLLGCMLPASPLHLLLALDFGRPLVATSANRSGEPIVLDAAELGASFGRELDLVLDHDRPIMRRADDSVVRCFGGRAVTFRLGRGLAPLSLPVGSGARSLGIGAHEKAAVALVADGRLTLGPHVGDLVSAKALAALEQGVAALCALHGGAAATVVGDRHPDYASFSLAGRLAPVVWRVQHHHAHVLACAAEHRLEGQLLGLAWDGSGWGEDGTVWGGEALVVDGARCERVARLRGFALPGGERAVREPRRSALGVAYELFDPSLAADAFEGAELALLLSALRRGVNCPRTSSMGRLFDAVAALLGVCRTATYQEQAAQALEASAAAALSWPSYELPLAGGVLDWEPLLRALVRDRRRGVALPEIARGFHEALAAGAVSVATSVGLGRVVLTGGCFQNAVLSTSVERRLAAAGFEVYAHAAIPPNDGGLAAGQAWFGALADEGGE
jgi:hydrogenase maturation protein HypF